MSENENEVQDPSEPNRVENAVSTEAQPVEQAAEAEEPREFVREDETDRVALEDTEEETPLPSEPVQGQSADPAVVVETPAEENVPAGKYSDDSTAVDERVRQPEEEVANQDDTTVDGSDNA